MADTAPPESASSPTARRTSSHDSLINELKQTAEKLRDDGATHGDLKILTRALKELRYAFKVFTPYRHQHKVTVFGSARTLPGHPAYRQSVAFGRRMAEHGWMVLTGAGGGIMEGAHVGAGRTMAMGANILLPFEQEPNYVIADDVKLVHLKYFFTRKLIFVKEVHAVTLLPGGFGTQDEGFETLTLIQTGKRDLMPVVLLDEPGGNYWASWLRFVTEQLLARELIAPHDLQLFKLTDDVEAAVAEIMQFYRGFDSMRYIRDWLVLRLHATPDDELLARLNDEFSDILASDRIARSDVHPFEADEDHLRHLPRIRLHFNRRDFGRLRQMIDLINVTLTERFVASSGRDMS